MLLNFIWLGMMLLATVTAVFTGHVNELVKSITDSAKLGFDIALGLTGIMALWLGLMAIATESGLLQILAQRLKPILVWLFPSVPVEHPAMSAMVMNIAANMLGLSNAATPFGLKAMEELQSINPEPHAASHAMCTFLAINTSSVQLLPTTAIAFLAANGSHDPTGVIFSSLLATGVSTAAALIAVRYFASVKWFRGM